MLKPNSVVDMILASVLWSLPAGFRPGDGPVLVLAAPRECGAIGQSTRRGHAPEKQALLHALPGA